MRSSALLALGLSVLGPAPALLSADDQDLRYDPATVIDVTGIVEDIRETTTPPALRGLHLFMKPENGGQLDAYLGPTWFVKEFVSNFGRRSEVQVIGSKVKFGTSAVVLAREVRKGEITLYLRDKRGNPFWERQTLTSLRRAMGRVDYAAAALAQASAGR
jgi:hypothetical protein